MLTKGVALLLLVAVLQQLWYTGHTLRPPSGHKLVRVRLKGNASLLGRVRSIVDDMDGKCGKFGSNREPKFYNQRDREEGGPRIASGTAVREGQYPSFVGIRFILDGKPKVCGGTIIHHRVVLTAANCFGKGQPSEVQISSSLLPPTKWNESGKVEPILASHTCVADKYTPDDFDHDVAAIILKDDIKFNGTVQPACLPQVGISRSDKLFAIGAGKVLSNKEADSLNSLPMSLAKCPYGVARVNTCVAPTLRGAVCTGDGGGPIIAVRSNKHYLSAIISHGPLGCLPKLKLFSINLDTFKDRETILELIDKCLKGGSGGEGTTKPPQATTVPPSLTTILPQTSLKPMCFPIRPTKSTKPTKSNKPTRPIKSSKPSWQMIEYEEPYW